MYWYCPQTYTEDPWPPLLPWNGIVSQGVPNGGNWILADNTHGNECIKSKFIYKNLVCISACLKSHTNCRCWNWHMPMMNHSHSDKGKILNTLNHRDLRQNRYWTLPRSMTGKRCSGLGSLVYICGTVSQQNEQEQLLQNVKGAVKHAVSFVWFPVAINAHACQQPHITNFMLECKFIRAGWKHLNRFKQAFTSRWKFTYLEFLTCNICPHQKEILCWNFTCAESLFKLNLFR